MKTFKEIASEHFHIPVGDVRDELSSKDIPDWDSMNYLLFIAELEKEFGMSFTMDEVLNANTLGDLHAIVKARGSN